MAIYELRTYTLYVATRPEALEMYRTKVWPVIKKYENNLVGYFIGDLGALNEMVHIWKFEDDNDRRRFWGEVMADEEFGAVIKGMRPMIQKQESKLLLEAPWGPHP
jgi:hypothetical protein